MRSTSARLKDKRVLITGADRGIGSSIAQRFAAEGARVCLNVFAPVEDSAALLAEINEAAQLESVAIQADVRIPEQIDAMFRSLESSFGGLDILVNNAGVESFYPALDLPLSEWDRILDTNLRGSFLCAQSAGRLMRSQKTGGVILNISSIHDSVPRLGTVHYCASKAGITMLTKALGMELAEYGIRVVGIAPGAVETKINQGAIEKIGRSNFERWIPAGRLGATVDVADAAVFLVSEEASYITGTTLLVDGAYTLATLQYDPRKLT